MKQFYKKSIKIFSLALILLVAKPIYSQEIEKVEEFEDRIDINETEIFNLANTIAGFEEKFSLKFFGSIAFRHCYMSENIITKPSNIVNNILGNNFQTRISAGIKGKTNDEFNYSLRFLTINNNSYNFPWLPAGTNDLRLNLSLDRYEVNYKPKALNNRFSNLTFSFGKDINTLPETEMLFDEDISFPGLKQSYTQKNLSENIKNISFELNEKFIQTEGNFNTTTLLAAKASTVISPLEKLNIKAGLSYLDYINAQGLGKYNFFQGFLGSVSTRNNLNNNNEFTSDFNLINANIKVKYDLNKLPLEIYTDFINNLALKENNKAFLIGFKVGEMKEIGDLFFNYNYKFIEQEANLSFFVEDIMGGTNAWGNHVDFGIKLAQKTFLFFNVQQRNSITKKGLDNLYIIYSNLRQDF